MYIISNGQIIRPTQTDIDVNSQKIQPKRRKRKRRISKGPQRDAER